jgi:hypothetical protein
MRAIKALKSVRVNFHSKWMRDALEIGARSSPAAERPPPNKGSRSGQHLALHDREVDLDPVDGPGTWTGPETNVPT